jgi:hypothetical protein
MFELLKKRISKRPSKISKEDFKKSFFSDRNHQWISEDKVIKRSIEILLDSFTDEHIAHFKKHDTYLIPCQAHLSCAIGKTGNHHLILVFPELIQLLKSGSTVQGIAVLAHEYGHIYHQHTEQGVDTLQAQIEADRFAFDLGFGEELQEVLLDHVYSIDCRVRISRLTTDLLNLKK